MTSSQARRKSSTGGCGSPRASAELHEARSVAVGAEKRDASVRLPERLQSFEARDAVGEHRGGRVELEGLEVDEPALVEGRSASELAVRDEHPAGRLVREPALRLRLRLCLPGARNRAATLRVQISLQSIRRSCSRSRCASLREPADDEDEAPVRECPARARAATNRARRPTRRRRSCTRCSRIGAHRTSQVCCTFCGTAAPTRRIRASCLPGSRRRRARPSDTPRGTRRGRGGSTPRPGRRGAAEASAGPLFAPRRPARRGGLGDDASSRCTRRKAGRKARSSGNRNVMRRRSELPKDSRSRFRGRPARNLTDRYDACGCTAPASPTSDHTGQPSPRNPPSFCIALLATVPIRRSSRTAAPSNVDPVPKRAAYPIVATAPNNGLLSALLAGYPGAPFVVATAAPSRGAHARRRPVWDSGRRRLRRLSVLVDGSPELVARSTSRPAGLALIRSRCRRTRRSRCRRSRRSSSIRCRPSGTRSRRRARSRSSPRRASCSFRATSIPASASVRTAGSPTRRSSASRRSRDVLLTVGFSAGDGGRRHDRDVTPQLLSPHGVVVLGTNAKMFTPAEETAIETFVRGGGGLVSYSDSMFGPGSVASDNQILSRFGLLTDRDNFGGPVIATTFAPHPISAGVSRRRAARASASSRSSETRPTRSRRHSLPLERRRLPPISRRRAERLAQSRLTAPARRSRRGLGRVVATFDRNTFFNFPGYGTNITDLEPPVRDEPVPLGRRVLTWTAGFSRLAWAVSAPIRRRATAQSEWAGAPATEVRGRGRLANGLATALEARAVCRDTLSPSRRSRDAPIPSFPFGLRRRCVSRRRAGAARRRRQGRRGVGDEQPGDGAPRSSHEPDRPAPHRLGAADEGVRVGARPVQVVRDRERAARGVGRSRGRLRSRRARRAS